MPLMNGSAAAAAGGGYRPMLVEAGVGYNPLASNVLVEDEEGAGADEKKLANGSYGAAGAGAGAGAGTAVGNGFGWP